MSSVAQFLTPVNWVKTPINQTILNTLTPLQERIWNRINAAIQMRTRNGRISVPEIMRLAKCSESTVYRALRALKKAGLICLLVAIGKTTVYSLPLKYAGPKPTPVSQVAPTPVTPRTGHPYIERDKVLETTTSGRGVSERPVVDDWIERMLAYVGKNGIDPAMWEPG